MPNYALQIKVSQGHVFYEIEEREGSFYHGKRKVNVNKTDYPRTIDYSQTGSIIQGERGKLISPVELVRMSILNWVKDEHDLTKFNGFITRAVRVFNYQEGLTPTNQYTQPLEYYYQVCLQFCSFSEREDSKTL